METKEVDTIQKIKYVGSCAIFQELGGEILMYSLIRKANLEKAYNILINNPRITAEEYLEEMDMETIIQEINQEGLIQGEEFDDIDEMEEIDDMDEEW